MSSSVTSTIGTRLTGGRSQTPQSIDCRGLVFVVLSPSGFVNSFFLETTSSTTPRVNTREFLLPSKASHCPRRLQDGSCPDPDSFREHSRALDPKSTSTIRGYPLLIIMRIFFGYFFLQVGDVVFYFLLPPSNRAKPKPPGAPARPRCEPPFFE